MISLVFLSVSAISVTGFSLVPVYMRLLGHIPALIRMCQGVTSGLSITVMILCVWLKLSPIGCQALMGLELYLMTSSLTWFILDNMDTALTLLTKDLTSRKYRAMVILTGFGLGFVPVILVWSILSYQDIVSMENGMCWLAKNSHWSMAGVLLVYGIVEWLTFTYALLVVFKKIQTPEPGIQALKTKRRRLMASGFTSTLWVVANCIGCLAMMSSNHVTMLYVHGAITLVYAIFHGGLFVLGEYKINARLTLVYRLFKVEHVPSENLGAASNSRPKTSDTTLNIQVAKREVCRVPPLSKEGPKLGAVYRRKEPMAEEDDKF